MPKMKSKRGAVKRFTLTGSGNVKRFQAFSGHIKTKKSPTRRRNLRKSALVSPQDARTVKCLILG